MLCGEMSCYFFCLSVLPKASWSFPFHIVTLHVLSVRKTLLRVLETHASVIGHSCVLHVGIPEMELPKDQTHFTLFSLSLLFGGAHLGGEPGSIMAGGREVGGRSGCDSCL